MAIPIYENHNGEACTRCEYYAQLVDKLAPAPAPSFATRIYEGHLIRRSHTTKPIVTILGA